MGTRFYNFLILFLVSNSAFAYSVFPDMDSIALGMGDKLGYTTVRYACPDGDNANNGLSPSTPKKTLWGTGALFEGIGTATSTIYALCRGGTWAVAPGGSVANESATKEIPIVIRDYQKPGGGLAAPHIILNATTTTDAFFKSLSGGGANSKEGITLKNLEISSTNAMLGNFLWIANDVDYVTVDNVYVHDMRVGITSGNQSSSAPSRFLNTAMDDLTFTPASGGNLATIQRASAFPAGILKGDSFVVSGTASNKAFRVDSINYGTNTIYVSDSPAWAVVSETTPAGAVVSDYFGDGLNSGLRVTNSKFENLSAAGIYGQFNDLAYARDNEFRNNGFATATAEHHAYINDSRYADFSDNKFFEMGPYSGTGKCGAVAFVGHGETEFITIQRNYVYQSTNTTAAGCYAIVFDSGYASAQVEHHDNLTITGNYVTNFGYVGIGCQACTNSTISNNVLRCNVSSGACMGISVPTRGPAEAVAVGDSITSDVTISGNTIIAEGSNIKNNTATFGIKAQAGTGTAGAFEISNNKISGWYECIKVPVNTGGTATLTGNTNATGGAITSADCTAGN